VAQEINGAPGQRTAQRSGLRKPSAPIGLLTSRHKKELRNTLASAGAREPFFSACRKPRPQDSVSFAGRASRPQAPHPSAVRPFEPWCQQHRGPLHLRLRKFRIVVVSIAADRQSPQDRRCGWVGARFARRIPTGRLGRFSAFRGHTAPPANYQSRSAWTRLVSLTPSSPSSFSTVLATTLRGRPASSWLFS
jgi:hypothetical protein